MGKDLNHLERLVATASRLFATQGYHGTGLTQLLSESGAPKGSFYHHFPRGKEQLAAIALAESAAAAKEQAARTIAASSSAESAVQAYATLLAKWFQSSGFRAGCPITGVLLDTAPGSPMTSQAARSAFDSWVLVWAEAFVADGFARSLAHQLATSWVAMLEGAWILSRAQQKVTPFVDVANSMTKLLRAVRPAKEVVVTAVVPKGLKSRARKKSR